jgi:hypothetical protein
MGQLLFKKVFWAAVRGGTKRTTIRRWATPRVKPGQRAWSPGVGWLVVESVERVARLDQLSDADATADGFASAAEMRAALRAIYPQAARDGAKGANGAGDGRTWFRVAFRPERADATASDAARKPAAANTASSTSPNSSATSRATNSSSRAPSLASSRQPAAGVASRGSSASLSSSSRKGALPARSRSDRSSSR